MQNKGKKPNKKRPDKRTFLASVTLSSTQTFLKIKEPLVPPKPKELHSVYSRPLT